MPEKLPVVDPDERIILGKVTGYYGVKGWVKLFSYTDPRDNIVAYHSLQIKRKGRWQAIALDVGKRHGKGVIAHFSGYDTREAAAQLLGAELAITCAELKSPGKNVYYWHDLIDLQVRNLEGYQFGRVSQIIETAAHDVLVIRSELQTEHQGTEIQPEGEILIPFVLQHYIIQIDLEQGFILVDWQSEWNSG